MQQKEPTRAISQRQEDVMNALSSLEWMPKYPSNPRHIQVIAKAIANFCETVEVNHSSAEHPRPDDLGWVVPLDYLIDQVASTFTYFPAPIKFRRIYEERFPPLDGKTSVELEEDAE